MITIPTIKELYDSIINDLETSFGNNIPLFGKNFLRAMAGVQAAKLKIYYLAIGNLQKNIFVDTADPESVGGTLERFGRVKLNRNPLPAVAGQYEIDVTGEIGAVIAAGTIFKSDDDSTNPGKLFILDAQFTLATTTDTITVRALEAGVSSSMNIGETMSSTVPLANVDRVAEVSAEVIEPLSAETVEDYRQKVIEAYRSEPQGGAASDYRIWAADAQGVQKVYPYVTPGALSEIDLYVEATVADSTDGKGTPSAGILTEVEEVVNFNPDLTIDVNERARRPANVYVNYLSIIPLDIDITVSGFTGTVAQGTLVENAIRQFISRIRPFIDSADVLTDKNDTISTNSLIGVITATVPGVAFTSVQMSVDSSILSTYTFDNGEIPYFNNLTI